MKNKITSEIKDGVKIIHCEHIKNSEEISLTEYKKIMELIAK